MFSRFRPTRPGHATVVAYLALFVAIGGSSYAAITITGRNVKNSSLTGADVKKSSLTGSDVKNNSLTGSDVTRLKSADVSDHSLLAKDFASGQLPAGPKGDPGPFPDGTLPSGKTLRGAYSVRETGSPGFGTSISYGFALASNPAPHYVSVGATAPAECPGSAASPAAAPGHLCYYEAHRGNVAADSPTSPCMINTEVDGASCAAAGRAGAGIQFFRNVAGEMIVWGSWAVTAP